MDTLRSDKKFPDWRSKRFKIHCGSCWPLSLLKQFPCALIYRSFHAGNSFRRPCRALPVISSEFPWC